MNAQQLLITAAIAAAAGSVGAAVTTLALCDAPAQAPAASIAPTGAGDAALRAQLDELRTENRDLVFRVTALETRPAPSESREAVAAPVEVARASAAATEPLTAAAVPPTQLHGAVEDALRTIREQEDRDRDERRRQAELERLDRRLEDLAEQLGLAPYQTNDMRTILLAEDEQRDAMFAQARESGDFFDVRDTMRELRDQTQAKVAEVLTPAQYEKYQELDRGWGFGGGRGRGGDDEGGRRGRGGNDGPAGGGF